MKRARWTLGILLGLALLVRGLWWEENWRGRRAWEETCAKLRAKGEPVDPEDLRREPIPDEENVAMAPIFTEMFSNLNASRLYKLTDALSGRDAKYANGKHVSRPKRRPLYPDDMSHLEEWREYLRACLPETAPPRGASPAEEIQSCLSPWEEEFHEVEEALQRPRCRLPLSSADIIDQTMSYRETGYSVLTIPSALCYHVRPLVLAAAAKSDATECARLLVSRLRLARLFHEADPTMLGWRVVCWADVELLLLLQDILPVIHFDEGQLAGVQREISLISLR